LYLKRNSKSKAAGLNINKVKRIDTVFKELIGEMLLKIIDKNYGQKFTETSKLPLNKNQLFESKLKICLDKILTVLNSDSYIELVLISKKRISLSLRLFQI